MSDVVIVRHLERIDVVAAHLACVLQCMLPQLPRDAGRSPEQAPLRRHRQLRALKGLRRHWDLHPRSQNHPHGVFLPVVHERDRVRVDGAAVQLR